MNRTDLEAQKWRETLLLNYYMEPLNLPYRCDGFGGELSIAYTLDCKKVGLVMTQHKNMCGRVANLESKALYPSHVHDEPNIQSDHVIQVQK